MPVPVWRVEYELRYPLAVSSPSAVFYCAQQIVKGTAVKESISEHIIVSSFLVSKLFNFLVYAQDGMLYITWHSGRLALPVSSIRIPLLVRVIFAVHPKRFYTIASRTVFGRFFNRSNEINRSCARRPRTYSHYDRSSASVFDVRALP